MPQCPHCRTHQSPKETCGWCKKPLLEESGLTCEHGYTGNERDLCACPSCAGLPLTQSDRARRADAAASVVHDFIYGKNGVTKKEANEALWLIHDMLRPLYGDQGGG